MALPVVYSYVGRLCSGDLLSRRLTIHPQIPTHRDVGSQTEDIILVDEEYMISSWLALGSSPFPEAILGHATNPSEDLRRAVMTNLPLIRSLWLVSLHGDDARNWMQPLETKLVCLKSLFLVGEWTDGLGYSSIEPYSGVARDCPYLDSISLISATLDWANWSFPPLITSLSILYRHLPPTDEVSPPPDHDPGAGVPSLDRIATLLSFSSHLTTLTLSGCFEAHVDHSFRADCPEIRLESLVVLTLGGDGASLDALCRSFVLPAIHSLTVISASWTDIHSAHLLTRQLRMSSSGATVIPYIMVGGHYPEAHSDSIYVDFVEMPARHRRARFEACQLFSAWHRSCWTDLLVKAAFQRVFTMGIVDKCTQHLPPQPPCSSASEWATVCAAYPTVKRLVFREGMRWAMSTVDCLRDSTMWPELEQADVHLQDSVPNVEKECFGWWAREVHYLPRIVSLRFNRELPTRSVIRRFVSSLPSDSVNRNFSWILPFTFPTDSS